MSDKGSMPWRKLQKGLAHVETEDHETLFLLKVLNFRYGARWHIEAARWNNSSGYGKKMRTSGWKNYSGFNHATHLKAF